MYITLKSFEKIGNLTNRLNVLQVTSYTNRHYLELASKQKRERISDYLETEALEAIEIIESRIVIFDKPNKKKDYSIHENTSTNYSTSRKKGVSSKKPIEIV